MLLKLPIAKYLQGKFVPNGDFLWVETTAITAIAPENEEACQIFYPGGKIFIAYPAEEMARMIESVRMV